VRVRQLVFILASPGLAAAAGCHVFERDRAVTVAVVDAETKAPISGAAVRLTAPAAHDDRVVNGTTGADGVARLKAHPPGGVALVLDASASGYLPEDKIVPAAAVKAQPAGDAQPAHFTVEVYAGPRPAVELVIPPGYRGVVKATAEVRDNVQFPPGQRAFRFEVPPSGEVAFTAPAVFRHGSGPEYTAKYADGTELSKSAKDAEVGFRWLTREGDTQLFVVGTRADYEERRKALHLDSPPGPRSGGGGDGQQGGRRGGGGRGGRGGGGGGGRGGF
jgi:hypothetical protein